MAQKFLGKTQFLMRDALTKGKTSTMSLFVLDGQKKFKGKLDLINCSARRYYTFFDLHLKNKLNIVPIIAVDFSLANLTFEEGNMCIHTLKPGSPNDYIDALNAVQDAMRSFIRFSMCYGMGARTQPGEGPACNLISMTGDFEDPFVNTADELINCYAGTIKTVRLALPVNFMNIIKFVCDLAQHEYGTVSDVTQIRNYYKLVILMAGVIDDFQDSLNEILRAANLPISVTIVKIGANAQDNDSMLLMKKSDEAFAESERVFINLFEFERYKHSHEEYNALLKQKFKFDIMSDLPSQIEKFFELQHFDLDISANLIDSPKQTVISVTGSIAESSELNGQNDLFERSTVADQDTLRGTSISDGNSSIMTLTEANLNRQQEQYNNNPQASPAVKSTIDSDNFRSKVQQVYVATLYINSLVGDKSEVSLE